MRMELKAKKIFFSLFMLLYAIFMSLYVCWGSRQECSGNGCAVLLLYFVDRVIAISFLRKFISLSFFMVLCCYKKLVYLLLAKGVKRSFLFNLS